MAEPPLDIRVAPTLIADWLENKPSWYGSPTPNSASDQLKNAMQMCRR